MSNESEIAKVQRDKLNKEWMYDHGIDIENRIIRVVGAIGTGTIEEDVEGDSFDFSMCEIGMSLLERLSSEPITFKINSPGGDCYDALAIIGRMKSSPCQIITEGYGHVMSAATLILMAGNKRRLSKYCVPMFHKMSYMAAGSHDDVTEQVKQNDKEQQLWCGIYEEFSKQEASFWMSKMRKKEYYPTPQELLELGAVDELI